DGIDVASGAVLTLDGGTAINGSGTGTLTVELGGQLKITTGTGATLDGVIVDDDGTGSGTSAGIAVASGAVLTLDGNTQIQGGGNGTLAIASTGELSITGTGATLDGVVVTDSNTTDGIAVVATLTLDDDTAINGSGTGTLTVESTGELAITAGSGADSATAGGATLNGIIVTDDNITDGIDVASGAVLTLDGGTAINGSGTGTLTVELGGQLKITTG